MPCACTTLSVVRIIGPLPRPVPIQYVKNAASTDERKKFLALFEYFKKYGDKYYVDWVNRNS